MPWRNAPSATDLTPLPALSIHPFTLTDRVCVLTMRGELDLGTAGALEAALEDCSERGCERLIIDLSALRFIDCTGVDLLANFQRTLPARIMLAEPQPPVMDTLTLSGLTSVCEVFSRLDDALAQLRGLGIS